MQLQALSNVSREECIHTYIYTHVVYVRDNSRDAPLIAPSATTLCGVPMGLDLNQGSNANQVTSLLSTNSTAHLRAAVKGAADLCREVVDSP